MLNIDARLDNADWCKHAWDLPAYKSESFMSLLESCGVSLEDFKKLPVYRHAVAKELIVRDEWKGGAGIVLDFGGNK